MRLLSAPMIQGSTKISLALVGALVGALAGGFAVSFSAGGAREQLTATRTELTRLGTVVEQLIASRGEVTRVVTVVERLTDVVEKGRTDVEGVKRDHATLAERLGQRGSRNDERFAELERRVREIEQRARSTP